MSLTFRAGTTGGNASALNLVINKPAGTLDGDLLIANIYWEGTAQTVNQPTGWTAFAGTPNRNTGTSPNFAQFTSWKVASGEPASWTWTANVNTNFNVGCVVGYSGFSGTNPPNDVHAEGVNNTGTSITLTAITTNHASETVLAMLGNFQGTAWGRTSGIASNQRAFLGGCEIWDGVQTTAGSTGTEVYHAGTEDGFWQHIALLDNSGSSVPSVASWQPNTEQPYPYRAEVVSY